MAKKKKKSKKIKISSSDVERLLKEKHAEDVFVPQCKTGATFGPGRVHILDAWVMKKSWAHPMTIGYEIKASRGDFLHDEKWRAYLPFCNMFYFVCQTGMIKPEELPADTGLLYVSSTGTKLFTKKKAPYRADVTGIEAIYKYILIYRTVVERSQRGTRDNIDTWDEWMQKRDADKHLGHNVSKKIRQLVTQRISNVEVENIRLQKENEKLQNVKEVLLKLGINPQYVSSYGLEQRILDAATLLPGDIEGKAGSLVVELTKFLEGLKKFNESTTEYRN